MRDQLHARCRCVLDVQVLVVERNRARGNHALRRSGASGDHADATDAASDHADDHHHSCRRRRGRIFTASHDNHHDYDHADHHNGADNYDHADHDHDSYDDDDACTAPCGHHRTERSGGARV